MEKLDHLEEAARDLAAALVNQGECFPGLRDEEAFVYGALSIPEIRAYVDEAVEYAAQEEAVLTLGLLGHGFTPSGNSSHLYFMGKESQLDDPRHAYDVPQAVADVAGSPNLAGAVVIVDTCAAAGAVPDADSLVAGARVGGKRLIMLMGCAVFQEGIDMIASRRLAEVVRSGIRGRPEYLTIADIRPKLERLVPDQDLATLDWTSAPNSPPLWVARNAAWSDRIVRADDHPHLHAVLTELFGDEGALPRRWDRATTADYRERLSGLPWSMTRDTAAELVANLDVAEKAKRLLRSWLGEKLTTHLVRRGLEEVGYPLRAGRVTLDTALAHIADGQYPPADPGCQFAMATFVVALGWAAREDLSARELRVWAENVDAVEHLNDAIIRFRGLDVEASQPRLVISMDAFTDGWPEEVTAFLLRDAEPLDQKPFPCPARDKDATVDALISAVRWGRDRAMASRGRLRRIDIAAREGVLLVWCPEEVMVGKMLGVSFDVTLRWSEQINPPDDIWWVNDTARGCLERMAAHHGKPTLAWLSPEHVDDRDGLEGRLAKGVYQHKAFSLDHRPSDPALFRLLKAHAAIVLWPRSSAKLSAQEKGQMRRCLSKLQAAMRDAFRAELRDETGEVSGSLRAVWDDLAWLDFCDNFTPLQLDTRSSG